MDPTTKKHLNILIQLAHADKHFAIEEREMIYRIALERGIPEEVVSSLIRQPEPIVILTMLTDEQKISHLLECVELIFVDNRVFESEIVFVKGIAVNLGFKREVVDILMENFGKLSREELISSIISRFSSK